MFWLRTWIFVMHLVTGKCKTLQMKYITWMVQSFYCSFFTGECSTNRNIEDCGKLQLRSSVASRGFGCVQPSYDLQFSVRCRALSAKGMFL